MSVVPVLSNPLAVPSDEDPCNRPSEQFSLGPESDTQAYGGLPLYPWAMTTRPKIKFIVDLPLTLVTTQKENETHEVTLGSIHWEKFFNLARQKTPFVPLATDLFLADGTDPNLTLASYCETWSLSADFSMWQFESFPLPLPPAYIMTLELFFVNHGWFGKDVISSHLFSSFKVFAMDSGYVHVRSPVTFCVVKEEPRILCKFVNTSSGETITHWVNENVAQVFFVVPAIVGRWFFQQPTPHHANPLLVQVSFYACVPSQQPINPAFTKHHAIVPGISHQAKDMVLIPEATQIVTLPADAHLSNMMIHFNCKNLPEGLVYLTTSTIEDHQSIQHEPSQQPTTLFPSIRCWTQHAVHRNVPDSTSEVGFRRVEHLVDVIQTRMVDAKIAVLVCLTKDGWNPI